MKKALGSAKARRSSSVTSNGTSASTESSHKKKLGVGFRKSTPKISKLLGRHNLIELHAYLRTEEGQLEAANHGRSFLDSKGQNFLHRLCRLRPKPQIVYDLYEQCPEAIEDLDKEGRTPLHVAAMHGASRGVIDLLLEFNADAATQQDAKGRTPLHLYCEHCSKPESCDPGDPKLPLVRGPLLEVVTTLCKAGPQAINLEDNDDMTPLEYCINAEADEDVVWTLREKSSGAWENNATLEMKEVTKRTSMLELHQRRNSALSGNRRRSTMSIRRKSKPGSASSISCHGTVATEATSASSTLSDAAQLVPNVAALMPDLVKSLEHAGGALGDIDDDDDW